LCSHKNSLYYLYPKIEDMNIHIKNNIWWVGKTDWELRKFHGN
jgi:hypothetical protein